MALSSIVAAIFLTSMKLTVGVLTNSLGILSEALHSGIDLIAAFTTYYAVKKAEAPPDASHMYGHGKIESLASLVETVLLFITCIWIVYEAISRLLFRSVEVDLGIPALVIMGVSMAVDFTRSRALMKTAIEYRSQALEADAIHFSTDLISSSVVIFGILATMVGFAQFDSLAGIGVAIVTGFIGYKLLMKSTHSLIDGAPEGLVEKILESAESVEGIQKVGRIRVREAGPKTFIDMDVQIDRGLNLEEAHMLTDSVSQKIRSKIPDADVVVHAEPVSKKEATLIDNIRYEASRMKEIKSISNIRLTEADSKINVEFNLEVDGAHSLEKAHEIASNLEERVKNLDRKVSSVISHVEPFKDRVFPAESEHTRRVEIEGSLKTIVAQFPKMRSFRDVELKKIGENYSLTFCCVFEKGTSLEEAHDIASKIETLIKSRFPEIERVSVHMEPLC